MGRGDLTNAEWDRLESHPRTHQALRMMSDSWSRLRAGQARDTGQEGRTGTSLEQAVAVHGARTADDLRGVFCLPVLFTDAISEQVAAVGRYGFHFGMAAQYHNDLTDVWPTAAGATGSCSARRMPFGRSRRRVGSRWFPHSHENQLALKSCDLHDQENREPAWRLSLWSCASRPYTDSS
ncbi:hypothetical protein [Streptomyces sp. NPDC092952]|uniref:hypothetical protein n=1 Tax=Streptomyces sp. NPDC092952 TaxID=3366018 RepID=UPI00380D34AE